MMTGSMTTLPLSVPAKTHLHWCLHASQPPCFPAKILDLVCSFMTMPLPFFLNVISCTHNYVTALVQYSLSKITVFTWQQCLYVQLHNIVEHQIFIHASCLIVWSVCTTNCRAKLAFPWKHTISCELLVCCNSNEMDMRGNGIQLRQWGAWPGSQREHFSFATKLPAF